MGKKTNYIYEIMKPYKRIYIIMVVTTFINGFLASMSIVAIFPVLNAIMPGSTGDMKAMLSKAGCRHSLLSGSGPTVFCTFGNKKSAERVFKAIPKHKAEGVFLVKTYKGGIYGDYRG